MRATTIIWRSAGNKPSGFTTPGTCCTCGEAGTGQLFTDWVKPTFTDLDKLFPGEIVCDACLFCFTDQSVEVQQKLGKEKPQKFRNYSHFVVNGEWRVCSKGDKRGMLAALLQAPEVAIIAESGQKHLAFRCPPGWWQFEEQRLRPEWDAELYTAVESLYQAGCSKSEIETGRYGQKSIANCGIAVWRPNETQIQPHRGSLLFRLVLFLVQKTEEEEPIESGDTAGDSGQAIDAALAGDAGRLQNEIRAEYLESVRGCRAQLGLYE